jgi:hypothetical protein
LLFIGNTLFGDSFFKHVLAGFVIIEPGTLAQRLFARTNTWIQLQNLKQQHFVAPAELEDEPTVR